VLWFWGHEHRMAGYALGGPERVQAYGRCVGHGGMPVSRKDPPTDHGRLVYYDNRLYADSFGMNGYITMDFKDAHLTVKYFDISRIMGGQQDQLLIQEEWDTDAQGQLSVKTSQLCMADDFWDPHAGESKSGSSMRTRTWKRLSLSRDGMEVASLLDNVSQQQRRRILRVVKILMEPTDE